MELSQVYISISNRVPDVYIDDYADYLQFKKIEFYFFYLIQIRLGNIFYL